MTLEDYMRSIENKEHRMRLQNMLKDIGESFPFLKIELKWNQPMFLDHGVFILGFSVSKGHLSISPDKYTLDLFKDLLEDRGYQVKKMLFSIKWNQDVDMDLLKEIVAFNIEDRAGSKTFWRNK